MQKKFLMLLTLLLFTFSTRVSAQNSSEWEFDYEIPVTKIIDAKNSSGEFDHRVYYSQLGEVNALVIVCHGYYDANGNYGVVINNGQHSDYINAISEAIGWWIQKGKLNCGSFEGVVLVACHTGFAPTVSHIPILDMNLVMVNNYKGENGIVEDFDRSGKVVGIKIFRRINTAPYALGVDNTSASRNSSKRLATQDEVSRIYVP